MVYRGLGADEQESAGLFIRWVAPTDFDRAQKKIAEILLDQFSWDTVNPTVWRVVGFDGAAVGEWLSRYILTARQIKKPLIGNEEQYLAIFRDQYGYSTDDVHLYSDAFKLASNAGYITENISRPWGYEPETVADVVSASVKKSFLPVGILAVVAIAAYAFFSTGLPRYAATRAAGLPPRPVNP
jgi:hypothetical protein